MACRIARKSNDKIGTVYAKTGKQSNLYNNIKSVFAKSSNNVDTAYYKDRYVPLKEKKVVNDLSNVDELALGLYIELSSVNAEPKLQALDIARDDNNEPIFKDNGLLTNTGQVVPFIKFKNATTTTAFEDVLDTGFVKILNPSTVYNDLKKLVPSLNRDTFDYLYKIMSEIIDNSGAWEITTNGVDQFIISDPTINIDNVIKQSFIRVMYENLLTEDEKNSVFMILKSENGSPTYSFDALYADLANKFTDHVNQVPGTTSRNFSFVNVLNKFLQFTGLIKANKEIVQDFFTKITTNNIFVEGQMDLPSDPRIIQKFGSYENYKSIIDRIRRTVYLYQNSGVINSDVLGGEPISLTRAEAINEYRKVLLSQQKALLDEFNELKKKPTITQTELSRGEYIKLEYQKLKQITTNYDNLISTVFPNFKPGSVEDELEGIIDSDINNDDTDNLQQQIQDSEEKDEYSSLTNKVKDFLANIFTAGANSRHINPKFAFIKAIQVMSDVNASTSNYLESLRNSLQQEGNSEGAAAIVSAISDLYNFVTSPKIFKVSIVDNKITYVPTTTDVSKKMLFVDEGTFIYSNEEISNDIKIFGPKTLQHLIDTNQLPADTKLIKKGENESTIDFIKRIEETVKDQIEVDSLQKQISHHYRLIQNKDTLNSIIQTFQSLRERGLSYVEVMNDYGLVFKHTDAAVNGVKRSTLEQIKFAFQNTARSPKSTALFYQISQIPTVSKVEEKIKVINNFFNQFLVKGELEFALTKENASQVSEVYDAIIQIKNKIDELKSRTKELTYIDGNGTEQTKQVKYNNVEIVNFLTPYFGRLTTAFTFKEDTNRNTMARSLDRKKKQYIYSRGSFFTDAITYIIKDPTLASFNDLELVKFFKSKIYRNNIFLNEGALNRVYKIVDGLGTREKRSSISNERAIPYKNETFAQFVGREFLAGFLNRIAQSWSNEDIRYVQYSNIVGDRQKPIGFEINVLTPQKIREALGKYVDSFMDRPDLKNVKGYDKRKVINFSIFAKAVRDTNNGTVTEVKGQYYLVELNKNFDKSAIVNKMVDLLKEEGRMFAEAFVENKLSLTKNSTNTGTLLTKDSRYLSSSNPNVKSFFGRDGKTTKENPAKKGTKMYDLKVEEILPIAELFVSNWYVNSYFLDQISSGDAVFYKNSQDKLKRRDSAISPGLRAAVVKNIARIKYRMGVISDDIVKKYSLKDLVNDQSVIDNIVALTQEADYVKKLKEYIKQNIDKFNSSVVEKLNKDQDKAINSIIKDILDYAYMEATGKVSIRQFLKEVGVSEEDLDSLLTRYAEDYNPNDGQGFMTPVRAEELAFMFGKEYGLESTLKPIIFDINEEGRPFLGKYSSIVLTDELVAKYPALKNMRDNMYATNTDELLHGSGVKIGAPASQINPYDILTSPNAISEDNVVSLNNEAYKLQLNPFSEKNKVSLFTQLTYFLKILKGNEEQATKVYDALASLIELKQTEPLKTTGTKSGLFDTLSNILANGAAKRPEDEKRYRIFRSLGLKISNGVAKFRGGTPWNHPLINTTAEMQLQAYFNKAVLKTKIPGKKLILQGSLGITKEDGTELKYVSYTDSNGVKRQYAEAVIPEGKYNDNNEWVGLLSPVIQAQIKKALEEGTELPEIFITPDLMGFRIPSTELHSAVPLKIVGFYPAAKAQNIVVVPKEIVPLHGSDFDVDSLFVVTRAFFDSTINITYTDDNGVEQNVSYKKGEFIGYKKVNGKYEPDPTFETILKNPTTKIVSSNKITNPDQVKQDMVLNIGTVKDADGKTLTGIVGKFEVVGVYENEIKLQRLSTDNVPVTISKELLRTLIAEKAISSNEAQSKNALLESYYTNIVVESVIDIVSNGSNINRMMSPIEMDTYKNEIKELYGDNFEKDIIDSSSFLGNYELFESAMAGVSGTGFGATFTKNISYAVNSSENNTQPVVDERYTLRFGQVIYNTFTNVKDVFEDLDSIINLSIDNIKEQALKFLNINSNTMGMYLTTRFMLGEGNRTFTNKIFTQPVMFIVKTYSGTDFDTGMPNGILNAVNAIKEYLQITEDDLSGYDSGINITEENLDKYLPSQVEPVKNLTEFKKLLEVKGEEFARLQLDILLQLNKANKLSRQIFKLNQFTNLVKGVSTDVDTIDEIINFANTAFSNAEDSIKEFGFDVSNFLKNNPHISSAVDFLTKLRGFYEQNFFSQNPTLKSYVSRNPIFKKFIPGDFKNKSDATIRKKFLQFLYSGFAELTSVPDYPIITEIGTTINLSGATAFNQHMIDRVRIAKQLNPQNLFLKSIVLKAEMSEDGTFIRNVIGFEFPSSEIEVGDIEQLEAAFNELRRYDDATYFDTNTGKYVRPDELSDINKAFDENRTEYTNFQRDLLRYAIVNFGMNYSITNYAVVLPVELYKDAYYQYENYTKGVLSGAISSLDSLMEAFKVNMSLNFAQPIRAFFKSDSSATGYKVSEGTSAVRVVNGVAETFISRKGYDNTLGIYYDISFDDFGNNFSNAFEDFILYGNTVFKKAGSVENSENNSVRHFYINVGTKNTTEIYDMPTAIAQDSNFVYSVEEAFRADILHLKTNDIATNEITIDGFNEIYKGAVGKELFAFLTEYADKYKIAPRPVKLTPIGKDKFKVEDVKPDDLPVNPFTALPTSTLPELNSYDAAPNIDNIMTSKTLPVINGRTYSFAEVMDMSKKLYADNPTMLGMLEVLSSVIDNNMQVQVVTQKSAKWAGLYTFSNNNEGIKLNLAYTEGSSALTFIHEALHAATSIILSLPDSSLTEDQRAAKKNLYKLFEIVKKKAQQDFKKEGKKLNTKFGDFYGLKNVDEFISEAFSNPTFQKYLASIKVDKVNKFISFSNLFDGFRNFIAGLTGFGKVDGTDERNVLNLVITSTNQLIKDGRPSKISDKLVIELYQTAPDQVVQNMMNTTSDFEVVLNPDGTQSETYKRKSDNKLFNRVTSPITGFLNFWNRRFQFTKTATGKTKSVSTQIDPNKSVGQVKAESLWNDRGIPNVDQNGNPTKLQITVDNNQIQEFTFDEYKEFIDNKLRVSQLKGKIIERYLKYAITQDMNDLNEIVAFENEIKAIDPTFTISFAWVQKNANEILERHNINTLNQGVPTPAKDEVFFEQIVYSDALGITGSMDMLIKRANGRYSIADIKSGGFFDNLRFTNDLMAYADKWQIENTPRSRAKLQIALYAVMFKLQNPSVQYQDLFVIHLPNESSLKYADKTADVEAEAYIDIIESFLKDKSYQKKANLIQGNKSLYESIIEEYVKNGGNAKDLFDYTNYRNIPYAGEQYNGTNVQTIADKIKDLLATIQLYSGIADVTREGSDVLNSAEFSEIKRDMINKAKELVAMGIGRHDINQFLGEELDIVQAYLGQFYDVENPVIGAWTELFNTSYENLVQEHTRKITLLNAFARKLLRSRGMSDKQLALNFKGSSNVWGKYFVTVKNDLGQDVEKILHKDSAYPEVSSVWDTLNDDEKKFLDYYNSLSEEYVGDNGFIHQDAGFEVDETGVKATIARKISHITARNKGVNADDKWVKYEKGFFFKVPPSNEELREDAAKNFGSFLSPSNLKKLIVRKLTFFDEIQYEGYSTVSKKDERQSNVAIPLKYLGSNYLNSKSENYSHNLMYIANRAIWEYSFKKHMDPVYAYGRGLKLAFAEIEYNKVTNERAAVSKSLSDFMDKKLTTIIKRQVRETKLTQKPVKFNYEGTQYNLSSDKVMQKVSGYGANLVLALNPFSTLGNYAQGTIFNLKDSIVGSIFYMVEPDKDVAAMYAPMKVMSNLKAAKAQVSYFTALLGGRGFDNILLRKNDYYLLSREFDFFPDSQTISQQSKNIVGISRIPTVRDLTGKETAEQLIAIDALYTYLDNIKHTNKVTGETKSFLEWYQTFELDEDGNIADTVENRSKFKENSNMVLSSKPGIGEFKKMWTGGVRGFVKDTYTGEKVAIYGLTPKEIESFKVDFAIKQGNYRRTELENIMASSFGRMFPVLKKYITRFLFNLGQSNKKNPSLIYLAKTKETNEEDGVEYDVFEEKVRRIEGKWRTVIRTFVKLMRGDISGIWKTASPEERRNIIDAVVTVGMVFAGKALAGVAFGADPDEDDQLYKWYNWYVLGSLSQEYNPLEIQKNLESALVPIGIKKTFELTSSYYLASSNYVGSLTGDPDALTEDGRVKGMVELYKATPYASQYYRLSRFFVKSTAFDNSDVQKWFEENSFKFR
jgi:hypothetical protein